MPDPYDLQRFVDAQAPVYDRVLAELRRGEKTSHWMWFIFPQLKGLGHSAMARRYGIASRAEAEAYLRHPTLGPRLLECARLVNRIEGRSLYDIFDSPDDMKFRSSMTLFSRAAPDEATFRAALDKYCDAEPDPLTLELLE
ncbi:DUF1810 domain-containing protein [Sorangium sp. So ce134]